MRVTESPTSVLHLVRRESLAESGRADDVGEEGCDRPELVSVPVGGRSLPGGADGARRAPAGAGEGAATVGDCSRSSTSTSTVVSRDGAHRPERSRRTDVIRSPLTQVPLREPRSSTSSAAADGADERVTARDLRIVDRHVRVDPSDDEPPCRPEAGARRAGPPSPGARPHVTMSTRDERSAGARRPYCCPVSALIVAMQVCSATCWRHLPRKSFTLFHQLENVVGARPGLARDAQRVDVVVGAELLVRPDDDEPVAVVDVSRIDDRPSVPVLVWIQTWSPCDVAAVGRLSDRTSPAGTRPARSPRVPVERELELVGTRGRCVLRSRADVRLDRVRRRHASASRTCWRSPSVRRRSRGTWPDRSVRSPCPSSLPPAVPSPSSPVRLIASATTPTIAASPATSAAISTIGRRDSGRAGRGARGGVRPLGRSRPAVHLGGPLAGGRRPCGAIRGTASVAGASTPVDVATERRREHRRRRIRRPAHSRLRADGAENAGRAQRQAPSASRSARPSTSPSPWR